jgi:hypothetical protein
MNEEVMREEVIDAIDEIRLPPRDVLGAAMATIRAGRQRQRFIGLGAGVVAAVLAISIIGVLLAVGPAGRSVARQPAGTRSSIYVVCSVPVRTDRGMGFVAVPSGAFTPAGPIPSNATTYNPTTKKWLVTETSGISPDGKLVALYDNLKGHNQTLQLETSAGQILYTRENVFRILGWASDDSLLVTTVDYPARLLKISADGERTDWVDPTEIATIIWSFASGRYAWGYAIPNVNQQPGKMIVRLDLATGNVTDWYRLTPSFNDAGYGPILGLTTDGYPIVPQPKSDARGAVYVIRTQNIASPISIGEADATTAADFWPIDSVSSSSGVFLITTLDGRLYWSHDGGDLSPLPLAPDLHVYSFGGSCR